MGCTKAGLGTNLDRLLNGVDGHDVGMRSKDAPKDGMRRLNEVSHVAQGYVRLGHHKRLAKVHAHGTRKAQLGDPTAKNRVSSQLLEHEVERDAPLVRRRLQGGGILQNHVQVDEIGVRKDDALGLPVKRELGEGPVGLDQPVKKHDGLP